MRSLAEKVHAELGAGQPQASNGTVQEAQEFVNWMVHDHFLFVATCSFDVDDSDTGDGLRFVDGVVDHLVDEVVQTSGPGGADVHGRALAHRFQALEDLDSLCSVALRSLGGVHAFVPIVFVEGVAGQLFGDQALTVTFSLVISLLVALTVIPMLASRDFRPRVEETGEDEIAPRRVAALEKLGRGGFMLSVWVARR